MTDPAPIRLSWPDNYDKALAEIRSLTAENVRLKEALRFYADVGNILFMEKYGFLEYGDKNIDLQGTNPFGEKARAALTSPKASSAMVPPPSTSQEPS